MPIVVVRIEGHPQGTSLESGDWVVSSASNSDDDLNRYLRKPEDSASRWRIEAPKGCEKHGRIVDVEHLDQTIFSDISIDEDAIRRLRVFVASDRQSDWPRTRDQVSIIANPIAHGPHLCQTPRGRVASARPVSNPGSQTALVGDEGKVIAVTAVRTSRSALVGRVVIDIMQSVQAAP